MAYIIVLNPLILGFVQDADGQFLGGGDAPDLAKIAAATALVAGVLTILMGVVANFPLALAAGLGLNAFVAYSVASQMSWADAMGLVVLEGLIILILVLTGFRKAVFDAVPRELKTAIAVGIGLFIALIGLVDAGFVRTTGNAAPPDRHGHRRQLVGLARAGVLHRSAPDDRPARSRRARRHPARHRHHDGARGRRGEDRRCRAEPGRRRAQPQGLEPERAVASPTRSSARPTSACWASSTCSAPSSGSASSPWSCWSSACCWPTSSTRWAP